MIFSLIPTTYIATRYHTAHCSHAADSRGSKAFSGVCDPVCLSVRTITQKRMTQVFKLSTGRAYKWYDFGVKRSQGHKVQKGVRVAGVSYVSTSS